MRPVKGEIGLNGFIMKIAITKLMECKLSKMNFFFYK